MMTDAELKRCLNDYECESLSQMLREVAANSKHCTSEAGGRIPTWPLHEAAERLEAIAALPPQGDGWQDIASGLAKALRRLAYHAQTSGGTAGHDAGLVAAVDIGLAALREYDTAKHDAPPAAELERAPKQDGLAELRALTRDLPEKNEEVWAAGMNAIRDMLCDLERDDFKDIGNGYPAEIWAAMYDAAKLARTKG